MARDYARERGGRRSYRSKKSNATSWRWLAAGLILGLLIAGIIYLKSSKNDFNKSAHKSATHPTKSHVHKKPVTPTKAKTSEKVSSQKSETQFDFYTVLPKMSVETPSSNTTTTTPTITAPPVKKTPAAENDTNLPTPEPAKNNPVSESPKENPTPAVKERYLLKLSPTKSFEQADQTKAELTMLGFDVTILKTVVNNIPYYRINIGPYNSKEQAISQQKILSHQHIASTIIKLQ